MNGLDHEVNQRGLSSCFRSTFEFFEAMNGMAWRSVGTPMPLKFSDSDLKEPSIVIGGLRPVKGMSARSFEARLFFAWGNERALDMLFTVSHAMHGWIWPMTFGRCFRSNLTAFG